MSDIKKVIRWSNDMVMVFGEDGQQMPDFQGPYDEVKNKLSDSIGEDEQVVFEVGKWREGTREISRDEFFADLVKPGENVA